MRRFGWLAAGEVRFGCDLRRCGWRLLEEPARQAGRAYPLLVEARDCEALLGHPAQARALVLGVGDGAERARLVRLGFGDVLAPDAPLAEIEARAARIAEAGQRLPRLRQAGPLTLDLLLRDGFVDGRALALHPREFALIWRLAETPGTAVAKAELLADVWRLRHAPETNSVAVHVFRLRAKLALARLDGLVRTAPAGGYMLDPSGQAGRIALYGNH